MTMAAALDHRNALDASGSRVSNVVAITDMASAESLWRQLEADAAFATPYQRYDFQAAWHAHRNERAGVTPRIVVAYDAARQPLMLLPLGVADEFGVRLAEFFGGKHVSFNMPLWQRDFAASATKQDIDAIIAGIRAQCADIDILSLTRQPAVWLGTANPFALLPHQRSVNDCPLLNLTPGDAPANRISNSFRRRLKGKERKLQSLPGYRSFLAQTDAEIDRVLEAFFRIKPLRMAEQKLPDVFAEPGIEPFIRQACHATLPQGGHAIALHALECDDEVIALFAGVADANRFSMMFNTYTMSANAKYSPGLILMRDIIDHYAERGVRTLDLGVGSDDYKRLFCKDDQPMIDSFVPLTARGALAAPVLSSIGRAKRAVKQTPALMKLVSKLRGAAHD